MKYGICLKTIGAGVIITDERSIVKLGYFELPDEPIRAINSCDFIVTRGVWASSVGTARDNAVKRYLGVGDSITLVSDESFEHRLNAGPTNEPMKITTEQFTDLESRLALEKSVLIRSKILHEFYNSLTEPYTWHDHSASKV